MENKILVSEIAARPKSTCVRQLRRRWGRNKQGSFLHHAARRESSAKPSAKQAIQVSWKERPKPRSRVVASGHKNPGMARPGLDENASSHVTVHKLKVQISYLFMLFRASSLYYVTNKDSSLRRQTLRSASFGGHQPQLVARLPVLVQSALWPKRAPRSDDSPRASKEPMQK